MRAHGSGNVSLRPEQERAADSGAKGMIPVGRPFLEYVISALADAGITTVVLVIGPEQRAVREYFTVSAPPSRVRVGFAEQAEAKGTADAVLAGERALDDAPFLVLNADNYYPVATVRAVAALGSAGLACFEADVLVRSSNIDAERVLRFALCDVDEDGWLRAIVEKPGPEHPLTRAAHRLVSMNLWSFTSQIFEACRRTTPSPRGELELVTAVLIAMRELGERFRCVRSSEAVLDLSSRQDIASVAARLRTVEARP